MITTAKTTYGDFRTWSTSVLHKQLEKVINSKQGRRTPYFMLVIIQKGYFGPPAFSNANHLMTGDNKAAEVTQDMNLSGKVVFSCRIILMESPPVVPLLGTALWKIDNARGEATNIYTLPPDTPVDSNVEMPEGSELVYKCGKHMPLVYNRKN